MASVSKKRGKTTKAKSTSKKKTKTKKSHTPPKKRYEGAIDKALIDNFITLQKIMVNFSTKFDALSSQISKLLELFEISAKSLARKDLETDNENKDIKKVLEKLDGLSQQSGLIGKGLALIHQINSEQKSPLIPSQPRPPIHTEFQRRSPPRMQGYQKSIASRDLEPKPSSSMTKEIPK